VGAGSPDRRTAAMAPWSSPPNRGDPVNRSHKVRATLAMVTRPATGSPLRNL